MTVVKRLAHAEPDVAFEIHAVQMRAYAHEARLIGAIHFPPLQRTVEDIRASTDAFIGAFDAGVLVGVLGHGPGDKGFGTTIASLAVDPLFHRRGVARLLMGTFLAAHGSESVTVQTGAKNTPALALYAQAGFVEIRRWQVGRERLELVQLRRVPQPGEVR